MEILKIQVESFPKMSLDLPETWKTTELLAFKVKVHFKVALLATSVSRNLCFLKKTQVLDFQI